MNKTEFLSKLRAGLSGLPGEAMEERLSFYAEMIDDRVEDGLSEEEAVAQIGDVDEIIAQTIAETPLYEIVKEKMAPKRKLKAWEIVLLILGSPLWLPLLVSAFAILLSLYLVLWSLVIALWAVEVSLLVGFIAALALSILLFVHGEVYPGLAMLGGALMLAGLSVFLFVGCLYAVRGTLILTKKIALGLKALFVGKGETK